MKKALKSMALILVGAICLSACNKGTETESEGAHQRLLSHPGHVATEPSGHRTAVLAALLAAAIPAEDLT